MNDQRHHDEGDWGRTELDPHERADADLNLDDPSAGDDEPWSPPDRQPRGSEFIGLDTGDGESLEQRLRQEEPEEGTAYGAPSRSEAAETDRTRGPMLGGDDPDAIPAWRDQLGVDPSDDDAEGDYGDDTGYRDDRDYGRDYDDRDTGSPEERAMHLSEE